MRDGKRAPGRLSMAKKPASSRVFRAEDFPDPDMPDKMTTSIGLGLIPPDTGRVICPFLPKEVGGSVWPEIPWRNKILSALRGGFSRRPRSPLSGSFRAGPGAGGREA